MWVKPWRRCKFHFSFFVTLSSNDKKKKLQRTVWCKPFIDLCVHYSFAHLSIHNLQICDQMFSYLIFPSQVYGFKLQRSKGAELRILIVFCYYAILGISALTAFNVSSRQLQEFSSELDAYFLCERGGIGNNCDRSGFESFTNPALVTIGFILVGIYPAINLVYVIHSADLKSLKQKCQCLK